MIRPRPIMPPPPSAPRTPVRAVIALGSNLGDRQATLQAAKTAMQKMPLVSGVTMATPIESVALTLEGLDDSKPTYLNSVALVTTTLAPSMLLAHLQGIEREFGRERAERWGDRTLDLDLIAYGDVRSDDPRLTLPHPRAAERDFVLAPWLAVDSEAVLPGFGRVDALLQRLKEQA